MTINEAVEILIKAYPEYKPYSASEYDDCFIFGILRANGEYFGNTVVLVVDKNSKQCSMVPDMKICMERGIDQILNEYELEDLEKL